MVRVRQQGSGATTGQPRRAGPGRHRRFAGGCAQEDWRSDAGGRGFSNANWWPPHPTVQIWVLRRPVHAGVKVNRQAAGVPRERSRDGRPGLARLAPTQAAATLCAGRHNSDTLLNMEPPMQSKVPLRYQQHKVVWGRRVLPPVGRATHNPSTFEGHHGSVGVDSMLAGLPPLEAQQGARKNGQQNRRDGANEVVSAARRGGTWAWDFRDTERLRARRRSMRWPTRNSPVHRPVLRSPSSSPTSFWPPTARPR